jgi:predicted nucleic-acid-binding Zn-ribbon protein
MSKVTKCIKCNSDKIQRKEVSVPSILEIGRNFPADAYVCLNCGYAELYFRELDYTTRPH